MEMSETGTRSIEFLNNEKNLETIKDRSFCKKEDTLVDISEEVQLGESENCQLSTPAIDSEYLKSLETQVFNENLDSIRSGESLIKHYNFDTVKYNTDVEKCIAFWETVVDLNDFKPAKCVLLECTCSIMTKKGNTHKRCFLKNNCSWYNVLNIFKQKRMDETALASNPLQCKMCIIDKHIHEEDDLCNEIKNLNGWQSTPTKNYQVFKEILTNSAVDSKPLEDIHMEVLQHIEQMDEIPEEFNYGTCKCQNTMYLCNSLTTFNTISNESAEESNICTCEMSTCTCDTATLSNVNTSNLKEECLHLLQSEKTTMQPPGTGNTTNNSHEDIVLWDHCRTCKLGICKCKDLFKELDTQFLKRLKIQLNNVRKSRSCETDILKEKNETKRLTYCIICGRQYCICTNVKDHNRYIQFVPRQSIQNFLKIKGTEHKANGSCISTMAIQKKISEHLKSDICFSEFNKGTVNDLTNPLVVQHLEQKLKNVIMTETTSEYEEKNIEKLIMKWYNSHLQE